MQFQEVTPLPSTCPSFLSGLTFREVVESVLKSGDIIQGAAMPPVHYPGLAPARELDHGPFHVSIDARREASSDLPVSLQVQIKTAIYEAALSLYAMTGSAKFRVSSLRGLSSLVTRYPHIDEPGFIAQKPPNWQVIIPLGRGTVVYPESTVNRTLIEPYMLGLMYQNLVPEDRILFRSEMLNRSPYDLELLLQNWVTTWRTLNPIVGTQKGIELPPFTPLLLRTGLSHGLVHRSPHFTSRDEDLERQVVQVSGIR